MQIFQALQRVTQLNITT